MALAIEAHACADAAHTAADEPLFASNSVLQRSAASHASLSALSICSFGSTGIVTPLIISRAVADRSARITGKGGHAERVFWATGTTRLLPRLIGGRTHGPVFVTDRAALRPMAKSDVDGESARARLSYRRAAELFTETTGWTLHQFRHSRLTHLAEDGVDTALLKAQVAASVATQPRTLCAPLRGRRGTAHGRA
jgi:hypothetical protein